MRKLVKELFFTIFIILVIGQVDFVSATEEAQNDLGKSIDALKTALEHEPSNVDVRYYLGLAYYDNGMVSEAVDEFNKIIELEQGYVNAYFYLGNIYNNQEYIQKGSTG